MRGVRTGPLRWLLSPEPRGRVAALGVVLYGFVFVDVLVTTSWVSMHGHTPGALYEPLFIGRLLNLPTPGPVLVPVVKVALLVSAGLALLGRWPRTAGAVTFALYLWWMLIAFSYGKVNHDRVAFLVALAVLPTAQRGRWGEPTPDEAAGWAVHSIQLAVVLTYLLATVSKLRYGGVEWLDGSTLMRGVLRRGTGLGDRLVDFPWVLHAAQYALVAFELGSPVMLMRNALGRLYVGLAALFHLVTWATLQITFLPHTVCLLAFLPLERLRAPDRIAALAGRVPELRFGRRSAGAPGP